MDGNVHSMSSKFNLTKRPPVNIEFQDLSFTVPQGRKGTKLILRSVSGQFHSGQLNAILGPSGAGKSTLLNILAGYKSTGASGNILINGEPRDIKKFKKISRYIMQEDLIQPMLTVEEAMRVAANLKLSKNMKYRDKMDTINEILDMLRLSSTKNTPTNKLSGGERKRLSIALELINNPPVIFLDEPTTGLDDLSCSQCIALLKMLAEGGRTVICSIHTPSAKLFSIFDNVYIISLGQCIYQGYGPDVVPFLSRIGLDCPTHYNPADYIIEVCCNEYGDYHDKMVSEIDNGRRTFQRFSEFVTEEVPFDANVSQIKVEKETILLPIENGKIYVNDSSSWMSQFNILLFRMWLQMWRDTNYLVLRCVLHILIGVLIGNLYIGMGRDGSKTIFNFGFYFTCMIFFMYIPMMPVLLQFPTEVQLVRREHFNKWYRLSSYFAALTVSTLPLQFILGTVYLTLVYLLSDQPLEMSRMVKFYSVCLLTGTISESFGLLISSTLNIVNGMFMGPVLTVPVMLLAVYGFGSGSDGIPTIIRIAMYFSYLRYSLEGLINAMLRGRSKLDCPESEEFCVYTDLNYFIREMGMENSVYWIDVVALVTSFVIFRGASYYLLRQRLTPNKTFVALHYVVRFVKSHSGISR